MNGVDVRKAQGIILKNLEKLDQDDKENILNKMVGAETPDIAEQNQVWTWLFKDTVSMSCMNQNSNDNVSIRISGANVASKSFMWTEAGTVMS